MIKFHRPVHDLGIEEGAVLELDASLEDMYVRQNYAEYTNSPVEVAEEKPKKAAKRKTDNAHVEGE